MQDAESDELRGLVTVLQEHPSRPVGLGGRQCKSRVITLTQCQLLRASGRTRGLHVCVERHGAEGVQDRGRPSMSLRPSIPHKGSGSQGLGKLDTSGFTQGLLKSSEGRRRCQGGEPKTVQAVSRAEVSHLIPVAMGSPPQELETQKEPNQLCNSESKR